MFCINIDPTHTDVKLFFFMVAALLCNLWYLVRRLVMVIARQWKDQLIYLLHCRRRLGYSPRYGHSIGKRLMKMLAE